MQHFLVIILILIHFIGIQCYSMLNHPISTILSKTSKTSYSMSRQAFKMNFIQEHDISNLFRKVSVLAIGSILSFTQVPMTSYALSQIPTILLTEESTVDTDIPKVPLYTKRSSDLIAYGDSARGFKLQRPFGWNEFDGSGGNYLKKFSSIVDYDENVVIGATPSSADKTSITAYGKLETIGEKLSKKRQGKVVKAEAHETDGIIFYSYEFENPLDESIPRTGSKSNRPTKQIELYELCVARGKLWSIQVTSNDRLFPKHAEDLRNVVASFYPRL